MEKYEATNLRKLCDSLPTCIPLTNHMKFEMSSITEWLVSYCPLSNSMNGWREKNDYNFLTKTHICRGKKYIPIGLNDHLVTMKDADMFHKSIYYYLAKLEPLWNQHKKVGTICDTKRHSSSHSHTSRDNKKCVTRDTPPPYSRHSDFRGPKTRGPSSSKSHINKRHCSSPDKFKSRRRVDSGRGEFPSDRDRGKHPSSSQVLTAIFNRKSTSSNQSGRGTLPSTPELMPKDQKPHTSCTDNESSFKLKCAERGRGNIPSTSHTNTAPSKRKSKPSNELGRGLLPTNTQLIPQHEKKIQHAEGGVRRLKALGLTMLLTKIKAVHGVWIIIGLTTLHPSKNNLIIPIIEIVGIFPLDLMI